MSKDSTIIKKCPRRLSHDRWPGTEKARREALSQVQLFWNRGRAGNGGGEGGRIGNKRVKCHLVSVAK